MGFMIAAPFEMALQGATKPALSRREREVAALVAEGLTNREIAQRLYVSERTVDAHLEHIREKLGVNARAQVAAWFVTQTQPLAEATPAPQIRDRRVTNVRFAAAAATTVVLLLGGLVVWTRQQTPPAATSPMITTIAGSKGANNVAGGYSGDSGPATSAQLNFPVDIAVGPTGYLYIADYWSSRIRRIDPHGTITTLAGGVTTPFVEGAYGPTTGIGLVTSVTVSPDGLVYFANGDFIGRVDPDLSVHRLPIDQILTPWGVRFGRDGSLYVSDTFGNKVWRRKPDGTLTIYAGDGTHDFGGDAGAATGAQLRYPTGLALDDVGNLFIADTGNNRIRRVDAASQVITTVAGSSDTYSYSGDGGPAENAELSLPQGVVVASNRYVYIADTGNNRVRQLDVRTHIITTVAGSGRPGFSGDGGPALNSDLYGPYAVTLDRIGDLYIADTSNHRIRMIREAVRP